MNERTGSGAAPIETVVTPRARDLGGFEVRRVLPSARLKTVGPFIFFDQMGPARFDPGKGVDVRPHPHIGLATVTYLFDGSLVHRDSLGFVQTIRPGDVNWMTAGRGIAHSERSEDVARATGAPLFGIQSWIALPRAHEETEPGFFHHPASTLPATVAHGIDLTLIAGHAFGLTSPVRTFSPMFYADLKIDRSASLVLEPDYEQRAIYPVTGAVSVDGANLETGSMTVLAAGGAVRLTATETSRVMLLGGAPLDGERHIWWNFVSSSEARIDQARDDWRSGRFDQVPGETEFIPLPD